MRFVLACCAAWACAAVHAAPAAGDPVRVKVALVAKCLQYVNWPEPGKRPELRIGLLGADKATAEVFNEMARNVSIGGKPVRIAALGGPAEARGIDVLYADGSWPDAGAELWKAIERKRIFLVTDSAPDRKYVMLNLVRDPDRQRLSFEINRANAAIEGFTFQPDLLLLGGTEIDVRALYRKMRDDLIAREETVRRKQAQLDLLGGKVDSMRRKMDGYAAKLSELEGELRQSGAKLASQTAEQKRLASEIEARTAELGRQIKVLESQKAEIAAKQAGIARVTGELSALTASLAAKEDQIRESRARIGSQEAELRIQGKRLAAQRYFLLITVTASILLFALGAAVYWAYRIKRAANENLEANVRKRTEELETAFRKQRELEADLQQAEKLKSIGQLAGGIAHDFNNQLGGIMGYADLLREKLSDSPRLREYAETILTLVGRSRDLTSQLLAFARKGQYQNVAVDLRGLIDEVMALLKRTLDKGIRLRCEPCGGAVFAMGDPSQLQNAILNLALNARDAMPQGGEIVFSAAAVDVPAGRDGSGAGGGRYVRVTVRDTGTGMDKETQRHIFEPFFTTKHAGGADGHVGTGMGLAAVLGTIQAHKGFIEVESEPGQGSEFRLYLPRIDAPAGGETEAAPGSAPAERSLRVLLVDDEAFMRDLAAANFASLGHSVQVCKDGNEALAAYGDGRGFDLVILDMMMPGMSGKELFHRLKAVNPDVVAVLASGYGTEADTRELLAGGVKGFIPKPYGKADLAAAIRDLLAAPAGVAGGTGDARAA
jgi:signal transduction histidine kinase/ActR/RegA family two-component response regulator